MHFQACHASRPVAGGRAGDQTRALLRLPTAVCVQLAGIAHQARVRFSRRGRSHDRRTPPRRRTVLCMTTARTARGTASSMPNGCVGVYIRAVGSTARTPPASRACPVSRSHTPVRALPCATTGQLRWIGISSAANGTSMSCAEATNAHGGCQRLSAAWSPSMAPGSPTSGGGRRFISRPRVDGK